MYIVVAPIQIKAEHKDAYVQAILDDAKGSVRDEPGCFGFDVLQDSADPNRLWVYEVYKDEDAFKDHVKTPHYLKMQELTRGMREESTTPAARVSNIWPSDAEWK